MKNFILFQLFFFILALNGCSVKEDFSVECVNDTITCISSPLFRIEADIPQEAVLTLSHQDGRCAVFSHEDYEITQEIFPAASWDEAFLHVTGRNAEVLNPILAGNFPQEEYRCSWSVAGENGTELCQCTILTDGTYYYALSIQSDAKTDKAYTQTFSSLLASVSLFAI